MGKPIIVKWQANNYFVKFIKSDKIFQLYKTDNYNKACDYIGKVGYENIPLGKWIKKIEKGDTVVFFDSFINNTAIELAKKKSNNIKVIVYYWNKINQNNEHLLKNKLVDAFYTFDKEDSTKYNIKYNSQFYTNKIKLKNKKAVYDVCFIGRDKKRKTTIDEIIDKFNKYNLKLDIRIITNEKDFQPYKKYLKMIENSKCILDIVANDQKGVSLRGMESIFFKKKLITNNQNIINYDFYNKNNIFIIGKDDWSNLTKFINSDYKEIDQKIIDYYDFENWIKRFE